ncbi:TRAP transporter fused permease subunit [Stappia taiwanensis]|uniref:TRAP transporter fused permease subunit n=1 Tax=Stappia taiwanensis TaxID=992267 RepID=A0A838XUX9_9HYPH|nr:TRAP transporter fused permease subunit [Stappia taiwanensis]MBA4610874.1 TRAP transporter fused permease subunit [Stappia taiwanensis]GGE95200.1 ATP-binding protein [Stappia taiwanensis]
MSVPARLFWTALGALSIGFHLYLVFSGLVPNLVSRPLHMALALPFVLVLMAGSTAARRSGAVIAAIGIGVCLWIALNASALGDQYGYLSGPGQMALALVLLAVVLEMARRAIGWPLPLVAALALAYAVWGEYIPGEFGHSGLPMSSLFGTLTITEGGVWGSLTGVSVSVVSIFVIFGAVLNAGEAGQGFMNVAAAAAGRLRGGAAKVSVLSSALFGSISGSASANVASTGAITLPAMTRLGYPRALAGAVEAVASSGGQIMPPLMGAGAFVMVELTGTPYVGIMAAAALPALLYFIAVWVGIDAFSLRHELKGLPADERPSPRLVLITSAFFLVPFSVLLWGMFGAGVTPQYAACLAIFAGVLLLALDVRLSFDLRRTLGRIETVCITGGRQIATIAAIILCASIIIGVLGLTGLGVKITSLILSGSGGLLWPALLLTAIACLILGMEVPTTAAYVICVSVAGPALIDLGLSPLQAHLFVFWYALLSTITPPVCGAVFIAAGMVGENWLKVAISAMALGLGLYLVPLGMIANPALIELAADPVTALLAMVKVGAGLAAISFGVIAPLNPLLRGGLVLLGAALLFLGG